MSRALKDLHSGRPTWDRKSGSPGTTVLFQEAQSQFLVPGCLTHPGEPPPHPPKKSRAQHQPPKSATSGKVKFSSSRSVSKACRTRAPCSSLPKASKSEPPWVPFGFSVIQKTVSFGSKQRKDCRRVLLQLMRRGRELFWRSAGLMSRTKHLYFPHPLGRDARAGSRGRPFGRIHVKAPSPGPNVNGNLVEREGERAGQTPYV